MIQVLSDILAWETGNRSIIGADPISVRTTGDRRFSQTLRREVLSLPPGKTSEVAAGLADPERFLAARWQELGDTSAVSCDVVLTDAGGRILFSEILDFQLIRPKEARGDQADVVELLPDNVTARRLEVLSNLVSERVVCVAHEKSTALDCVRRSLSNSAGVICLVSVLGAAAASLQGETIDELVALAEGAFDRVQSSAGRTAFMRTAWAWSRWRDLRAA